jgi:pyruvate ferredoxin oxidoreductase gamma subunit
MYRIRLHGRGGQGMKTASRILGTALFLEGYEVQDAPRYGAERRGAPIFAYVRAIKDEHINERGIIQHPDLVVVADDTLVPVPAAGVVSGLTDDSIVLINSKEDVAVWQKRLNVNSKIITLPAVDIKDMTELRFIGATCAGAAARLLGVISKDSLEKAIRQELEELPEEEIKTNIKKAFNAFIEMASHESIVKEGEVITAKDFVEPEWIDMPFEEASISAPVIYSGATSVKIRTGLWRTLRPEIDYDKCRHCWWVCSTFCPDSAINVVSGIPEIDYDHCKGCMICVAQCPPHAIGAIAETEGQKKDQAAKEAKKKETS